MNTLIPGAPLRSLSPTSNEYQRAEGASRAAKPARVARFTLDAPEHSGTIPGAIGDILAGRCVNVQARCHLHAEPTHDVSRYSANGSVEILNGVSVRKYMESIDLPFLEIKALENLASRSARLGQAS